MVSCVIYVWGCLNDLVDVVIPIYAILVIVLMCCFGTHERPETTRQYTYKAVTDAYKMQCPYISCFEGHWKMQRAVQTTQYAHCSTERSLTGTSIYDRVISFAFNEDYTILTVTRSKGGAYKSVHWKDIPIASSLKQATKIYVPCHDGPGTDTIRAAFNRDKGMLQLLFQEGEHSQKPYIGYFEGKVYIQDHITKIHMV